MIMSVMPVIPNNCRMPYYDGWYLRHTHISNQLKEIMKLANENQLSKIYQTVASMICKSPANAVENADKATAMDQLQGKQGLIRANALGKPGNQHMRTVSGPDSTIRFGEVRFPRMNTMLLTKTMTVTKRNLALVKTMAKKDMLRHYILPDDNVRRVVHKGYIPAVNHTVHRTMVNGDTLLLNRQPTLHKGSVLGVDIVICSQLTTGLHMSYTPPMNADFDGDENNSFNLHDLLTISEARILKAPKYNFMAVLGQSPMYGLVINGVTAAYLMSKYNAAGNRGRHVGAPGRPEGRTAA
jgi:DNA-directed RNA polymerase beta' subunit